MTSTERVNYAQKRRQAAWQRAQFISALGLAPEGVGPEAYAATTAELQGWVAETLGLEACDRILSESKEIR